jgi:hypothetical protein
MNVHVLLWAVEYPEGIHVNYQSLQEVVALRHYGN